MSASTILRRPVFWVCAALGLLASCIDDFADSSARPGITGGDREVIIKLEVPQQVMPPAPDGGSTTRTVETPVINDLYILAFQATGEYVNNVPQEPYLYYVRAEKNGSDQSWTATLKSTDYTQTFVMLANVENQTNAAGDDSDDLSKQLYKALTTAAGKNKADVLKDLYVSVDGRIDKSSDLPLTGQTEGIILSDQGTQTLKVSLYRMVAGVNVYTTSLGGSELKGFAMQEVSVYNTRLKGLVASAQLAQQTASASTAETPQAALPTAPTLPDADGNGQYDLPNQAPLTYTTQESKNGYAISSLIYLFETGQPDQYPLEGIDPISDDLGAYRPCLVVKGEVNGIDGIDNGTYYWRIDLKDKENENLPMNIVRNHQYNIIINAILGKGSDTPEEALKTSQTNIDVSIVAWNDGDLGGVSFGENNFLGLGKIAYKYGVSGSLGLVEQTVAATPELEWTAVITDDKGQTPDWISFYNTSPKEGEEPVFHTITAKGQGIDKPTTLQFIVDSYEEGAPTRIAYITFTAANLQNLKCTVTQTSERILALNAGIGTVIEFTDNGSMMGVNGVDVLFGPGDTKLSWYASPGTLSSIDGDVLGELEGFENSNRINFGDPLNGGKQLMAGQMPQGVSVPEGSLYLMVTDLKDATNTLSAVIPMKQLKYWLNFRSNIVLLPSDGSEVTIDVLSNFKWKCTGYCTPELANENGLNETGPGAVKRDWATPETIRKYEELVNAFTGEQSGDPNGTSVFTIRPKAFNENDLDQMVKLGRMDFFFTDETGKAIVKSDSLGVWRAFHDNQGNVYKVKRSDKKLTFWEYCCNSKVDGLDVFTTRESPESWKSEYEGAGYNVTDYWTIPTDVMCRELTKIYPNDEFWYSDGGFPTEHEVNTTDGLNQYFNTWVVATIANQEFNIIPVVEIARVNEDNNLQYLFMSTDGMYFTYYSIYRKLSGRQMLFVPLANWESTSIANNPTTVYKTVNRLEIYDTYLNSFSYNYRRSTGLRDIIPEFFKEKKSQFFLTMRSGLKDYGTEVSVGNNYKIRFHTNMWDETHWGYFVKKLNK